jgi:hypothetical protein
MTEVIYSSLDYRSSDSSRLYLRVAHKSKLSFVIDELKTFERCNDPMGVLSCLMKKCIHKIDGHLKIIIRWVIFTQIHLKR